jgi:hypothetical protein
LVIEIIDGWICGSNSSFKCNNINLKSISHIWDSNSILSYIAKTQEISGENGNQIFIQIKSC